MFIIHKHDKVVGKEYTCMYLYIIVNQVIFWQDGMVTMHDVLDAQWQMDNAKNGMYTDTLLLIRLLSLYVIKLLLRIIHEKSGQTTGSITHQSQENRY